MFVKSKLLLLYAVLACCASACRVGSRENRPNILIFITDDQSWPHASAYGTPGISTLAFDKVASAGVLFNNAHVACPSCSPSRAAILTGQAIWRLEEAAVFGLTLPSKFEVFPMVLEESGYHVGWVGKGWGPGDLRSGGWKNRNPLGRVYNTQRISPPRKNGSVSPDQQAEIFQFDYAANFAEFLKAKEKGQPFAFWCGTIQPHTPYVKGSGLRAGKKLSDAPVPGYLPNLPEIRSYILDYFLEIEYADSHLDRMIKMLKEAGELENTLIVATSDNGIGLPAAKSFLYEMGTHVPLAICWPNEIPGGRLVDDFVNLTDLAPTFLNAAGVTIPGSMTGRSLLNVLKSKESGLVDPKRSMVVTALERHDFNNPMRAIRTHQYSYIRNIATVPERPPPSVQILGGFPHFPRVGPYFERSFRKRPAEELYNIIDDPWQMKNLANNPDFAKTKRKLSGLLDHHLQETGDPRMRGENPFATYPFFSDPSVPKRWMESSFGLPVLGREIHTKKQKVQHKNKK